MLGKLQTRVGDAYPPTTRSLQPHPGEVPMSAFDPTVPAESPAPISNRTPPPVVHNCAELGTETENRSPSLTPAPLTPPLTPQQITAITLLTAGKTIASTASILGVHRN